MTFKGVIFDMDGVISQSLGTQSRTEAEILAEYGIKIKPKEIIKQFNGSTDIDMFRAVLEANGVEANPEELSKEKWEKIYKKTPSILAVEGVLELIKNLHKEKIPMSVASGSPAHFIKFVLESLEIIDLFEGYISGKDVPNGKPAPDVYIKAIEIIKQNPHECVVIEDSIPAMRGAKEAGCKTIGYLKNETTKDADLIVDNLAKLKISDFYNLFV